MYQKGIMMSPFDRRDFLLTTAVAGAGLMLTQTGLGQITTDKTDDVNVAIIGVGRQGKILLNHLLTKVAGIRMKAVCDIWAYGQTVGGRLCKAYKQEVNVYEDYREMLAQEKDLDAVVICTPDFMHHEMTNACLQAGLHVYCEKEMSNDIEKARSMVKTAQETGKLLQIGHQRHSNFYYRHAYNLMHKEKFFGDITTVSGQWNQQKALMPVSAKMLKKYPLSEDILSKYEYENMAQFRNWRWFNKYAGGPMTDLGSHQVDVFLWYLKSPPSSVYAVGGLDYARTEAKKNDVGYTPECFDHTIALYEWDTDFGKVHGHYEVNLTSSHGGIYEVFMGNKGSMSISEMRDRNPMFKEKTAESLEWEDDAEKIAIDGEQAMTFDPLASRKAKGKMDEDAMKLEEELKKPAHVPHLENFFAAIRDKNVKLTCPAEVGFETCVAVIKANESALAGMRIDLKPQDFVA